VSADRKTLAVVGLGLLGASLAEATRKRYPGWRITGVSAPGTVKEALEHKVIDAGFGYEEIRPALSDADYAFLCLPIDRILDLLAQWEAEPLALKPGAVVSDVGSTKSEICAAGRRAFAASPAGTFIGSHPMAGSEKTGLKARDAHLFENAAWIVSPDKEAPEAATKNLEDFLHGLGARVLRLAPARHDAVVAQASHLPQLLATALGAFIAGSDGVDDILQVAGGGLRDMTRLAASSFPVWEPILRTNRRNLEQVLPAFRRELEILEEDLVEDGAERFFTEANALRGRFGAPRKGFSSPTTEILVDVQDKPGALLRILSPLAEAGLNVLDLEILKVREGEEGVLMMGFHAPEEAKKAIELLAASGHQARLRG
jgi:prephenate dehydrogenase